MKRKMPVLVAALLAVTGCTLNRSDVRQDNFLPRIGGNGKVIEPKRCGLQVAILSRPLRDESIDGAVWRIADEQVIPAEIHRALEVNGVRVGVITGNLPAAVEAVLKAPAPHRVEPMQISVPDGDNTLISLSESASQVSLLLTRDGQPSGKDYQDASGWYRVTATQDGSLGVKLRLVPEIHHGPLQRAYSATPTAGTYSPQEFMRKDGQQEETLRELATTLTLQPGQVAVIGCHADANRSLGSFLFTQTEVNSDRLLQKVVLIWASRTNLGQPANGPVIPPSLQPVEPPKEGK
jgi:hypothetical protein